MDPTEDTYAAWAADPSPENLHSVVKTLEPSIMQSLHRMNAANDSLMTGKARLLAADAVKSWQPGRGASLPTWTVHQLGQLHRFRRANSQVLQLPEGVQLDALKIESATREFVDKHGREPDEDELADGSQLSRKRIRDIRQTAVATPGPNVVSADVSLVADTADYMPEATDAVYDSSDKLDKWIMEGRMGYNGRPTVSTMELLKRTKLTPPQLARRVSRIAMRIQNVTSNLEDLYSR